MAQTSAEASALHEGVPAWMRARFWPWIDRLALLMSQGSSDRLRGLVARFDEASRLPRPLADYVPRLQLSTALVDDQDPALPLRFADYLIALTGGSRWTSEVEQLENILQSSGSAWTVGSRSGRVGLERRVDATMQAATDLVVASSEHAGELLSEAWRSAFGMNPDPDKAYSKAIKAVEEAAARIVSPKDRVATLGKMASAMRDQGNWGLPLEDDPRNPSNDVLVKMMRALHSGQQQRHGGNGDRAATQQEAETAVFLAVPLVQFFHAGLLAPRE